MPLLSKGRRAKDVIAWFNRRPPVELKRVEVVVLDMSRAFFTAVKEVFGDQVQVIDRFHIIQQAVDDLDGVLRSVQKQLESEEAKALKKLRKRWLKSADQLDVEALIARADRRRRFPARRDFDSLVRVDRALYSQPLPQRDDGGI